jgi:hypothetical protein
MRERSRDEDTGGGEEEDVGGEGKTGDITL